MAATPSRPRTVAALVGMSMTTGALLGAATLPFTVPAGASVNAATQYWDALPSTLAEPPLPQGSTILAADGRTVLGTVYLYNRKVVPLAQVAPIMRKAIVDIEDSRFYSHGGVDYAAVARVLRNGSSGNLSQGGSGLAQQYVKNTLLITSQTADDVEGAKAATARSLERKLREAKLAIGVEQKYTKDQILEKYLNIAYFGDGAYGVEAAAQRLFGVPASKLGYLQSATIAGLVQSPTEYAPLEHPKAATTRRNIVLARMAQLGTITAAQAAAGRKASLGLHPTEPPQGCRAGPYPFYCDWVTSVLTNDPSMGRTAAQRRTRLLQGGLVVRTALDPPVQAKAQAAVDAVMPHDDRVAAVDVSVQPGTGRVQAIAINRDYGTGPGQTVFPLASTASAQVGSTFKAFTLAAALEAGVPLSTRLPGGDSYHSEVFDNPASGAFRNDADGFGSNLTLTAATASSVNTAFVQLEEKVGVLAVADLARRAGVTSLPSTGPAAVGPREGSLTLGVREVSPIDMANAYATFAAHGNACPAVAVISLTRVGGRTPQQGPSTTCRQTIAPAVADTVTSVLESVIAPGGTGARQQIGRPAAGKTGTTENEAAAWFVGYTPQESAAVWLGDPRGGQAYPLLNVHGYAKVFGGTLPGQIWRDTMMALLEGVPVVGFPGPDPSYGDTSSGPLLPTVVGLPLDRAKAVLARAGVVVRTALDTRPGPAGATLPPDTVVAQTPAAGVGLPVAGPVTLTLSP